MRHAGAESLNRLEPLLVRLRALEGVTERGRGVFYRKSRAFLHFHEDPSGLHADLRCDGDAFQRSRVETEIERNALFEAVRAALDR
jgi:hypothetical protein